MSDNWKNVQQILKQVHRDEPREIVPPAVKYAHEDATELARREERLRSLAGIPLIQNGQIIYHCQVCLDMQWLREDVSVGHRLFGRMRLCPCNSEYAIFGAEWYGRIFAE